VREVTAAVDGEAARVRVVAGPGVDFVELVSAVIYEQSVKNNININKIKSNFFSSI
jgi:hypothetical protein